jgi:hypothetical protein
LSILSLTLPLFAGVLRTAPGRLIATPGLSTLSAGLASLAGSAAVMFHLLGNSVRQFSRRVARILALVLLRNVLASLLRLFSILYPFPSVIDFVGTG